MLWVNDCPIIVDQTLSSTLMQVKFGLSKFQKELIVAELKPFLISRSYKLLVLQFIYSNKGLLLKSKSGYLIIWTY